MPPPHGLAMAATTPSMCCISGAPAALRAAHGATRSPFDLYYIGYENDEAVFNQGRGRKRRQTFGTRYFGTRGPWKWDLEANFQAGDFAGSDIRAGSLDAAVGHTCKAMRYTPYVELRANIISGDRDKDDQRLNGFNAMFPTGQYFGDIGQLGPLTQAHDAVAPDRSAARQTPAPALHRFAPPRQPRLVEFRSGVVRNEGHFRAGVFIEVFLLRGDLGFSVRPWARVGSIGDNPDIGDYRGSYELRGVYERSGHVYALMLRNLFRPEKRYNAELNWSFPIAGRLRGMLQWYDGYGENLIDYNFKNRRLGVGVLMSDWL